MNQKLNASSATLMPFAEVVASDQLRIRLLGLFGLLIEPGDQNSLPKISVGALRILARKHQLLVLRGFDVLCDDEFVKYCSEWGELFEWNFGFLLDLIEHPEPRNYLFTSGKVPMHWDGAFREHVPEFQIFRCVDSAAGCGGETLFADTHSIVEGATPEQLKRWRSIAISYKTEQVAHYGGCFTSPLICRHPRSSRAVIRYGEPADEATSKLNPFEVSFAGVDEQETELTRRGACK
jgi:alpha-ketoglutarate-dependent taurine dioxygenase